MFADDVVICSENREQVEEKLERGRYGLEKIGMKVSCSKTEYMRVNERNPSGTEKLQGAEIKKVKEFKYLGSTVRATKNMEKRCMQAGWNGWRKVSGVMYDKRVSAVRPAMLYGLKIVAELWVICG